MTSRARRRAAFQGNAGWPVSGECRRREHPTAHPSGRTVERRAAMRVAADGDNDDDLRPILAPGSSLGGARAKASVLDLQGQLSIAKFPQANDDYPVMQWEAVALDLAARAGIEVPTWRLEQVVDRTALLLRRFDRDGDIRIRSCQPMVCLARRITNSTAILKSSMRSANSAPSRSRIARSSYGGVSCSISLFPTPMTICAMRFPVCGAGGWRLSPAYDMNPTPVDVRARVLSLIDEADDTASLDVAFGTAAECGETTRRARSAEEVQAAVRQWRACAASHRLTAHDIARMASAFEHEAKGA